MPEHRPAILCTGRFTPLPGDNALPVDVIPFVQMESLTTAEITGRIAAIALLPAAVVFTSREAVRAVVPCLGTVPAWTIWCTSGPTQTAVAEFFGASSIAGVADNAAALGTSMIGHGVAAAFFFCGDQRREELPACFRAAGKSLGEVVVYRSLATPVRLEKSYDAILFFSPGAVESFFSVNTVGPELPLFCLGGTTAAALRHQVPNPVIVSSLPDKQILLTTARDYLSTHPIHERY